MTHRSTVLVLLAVALIGGCARELDPQSTIPEARALLGSGETGEARVLLKNLLVKHPDVLEARTMLARIALDAGDARAAEDELAGMDRAQIRDAASQEVRWQTDLALGRAPDVLKALNAPGVSLSDVQRAKLRSAALRATGLPADGIGELRAAMSNQPKDPSIVVELSAALAALGNLQQAEQELDRWMKDHSPQADVLLARGELKLRRGDAAGAIEDLRAAIAGAGPQWPLTSKLAAGIMLGDAMLSTGKLADAKTQLAAVEKEYPGAVGTQLLMARVSILEGRTGDAVDALQKIAESIPDNARVQYLLVDALVRSGNTARATELLARRIQSVPEDMLARRLLARLMLEQSRPDQVVKVLKDSVDAAGARDVESDGLLSAARLAQEKAGSAITSSEARLASNPADDEARVDLAAAYLQNGEAQRSLEILAKRDQLKRLPQALAVETGAQLALGNDRELNILVARLVEDSGVAVNGLLAAADAAQKGGRSDAAGRLVDQALVREPGNADALLRRANLEFIEQRYESARSALQRLVDANPANTYARLALARVAEAEGDTTKARESLRGAIQATPAALEPALMLAGLELRADQHEAAARVLDALLASAPKDGVAANAAGSVLLGARRLEEARSRFAVAVQQAPAVAEYSFNLGRTQLALDDRPAALQSFLQTVASRPDWLEANVAVVRLALARGDRLRAASVANGLAERLPRSAVAWLLVGETAAADRRLEDASRAFAKSYALQPSAAAALNDNQARALGGLARPDLPLLNWLQREPGDAVARRRLADYYLRAGANRDARTQLEKMIAVAPNDVVSLNNLAWLLADDEPARAETLARRAHSISPGNAAVADTLGWVLIQAGKAGEARTVLAAAVASQPKDASIRYHYALALARAGDRTAARQNLEEALKSGREFNGREAAQSLAQELSR